VVDRSPGKTAVSVLIWATLEEGREAWRGVRMGADLRLRIAVASEAAQGASIYVSPDEQVFVSLGPR
jgi:hypothetical protein